MLERYIFPKEFAPNPFYRANSLAPHVPIATVRDDTYVLTDGSFAAVFRVSGMEYDLADTEETTRFVESLRGILNTLSPKVQIKILHRLTHNYRSLLDEHQRVLDGDDVFARYIAHEQAQVFHRMMTQRKLLKEDNLIVLTYKPKEQWWKGQLSLKDVLSTAGDLLDNSPVVQRTLERYQQSLDMFENIIRPTVQQMGYSSLNPRRLSDADLYDLAWEVLNPTKSLSQPCPRIRERLPSPHDPSTGIFSSSGARKAVEKRPEMAIVAPLTERSMLAQSDMRKHPGYVELDGKYYAAISLRMLPAHVYPTMALHLAAIPFEATISIDCVMLQKEKELEKQWKVARSAKGQADVALFGGTPDPANQERAKELLDRYLQSSAGHENPFRMRLSIIVAGNSPRELDHRCDAVLSLLQKMEDARGVRETYAVDTLLKASWPFSPITETHTRKPITSEVANLLPIFSRWTGSKRPVTLVMDPMNRLLKLDPYPPDALNRNRTLCGASGSGKSFMCQLSIVQPHAARDGVEILVVESGGSFELTTKCFGGINIRLGPKSEYRINPFDLPQGFDSLPPETQEEELRYKYEFISKLILCMVDIRDTGEIKLAENVIGRVVQRTYSMQRQPRLRDFFQLLGQFHDPDDPESQKIAGKLRSLLRNYVVTEEGESGIYAPYFDCETNFNPDQKIITFDLVDVKNTPSLLIPLTMVALMGFIYNRILSRDGKDRIVVIDEAWALIKERPDGTPSPAGEALELFWREGRKMGAASVMISQNYSDMTNDKTGRAIVANSINQVFLVHERIADNDKAFQSANFSKAKMDRVYNLTTRYGEFSEMMVKEGPAWGVARLPSSGVRYWLATTDPLDLKVRARYEKTYGEGYNIPVHILVYLLARDYPKGAHDAQRSEQTEMSVQQGLDFAERLREKMARFGDLIAAQREARKNGRDPELLPYDFR